MCRDRWLIAATQRSGSPRTAPAYLDGWHTFFGGYGAYALAPWNVTATHAQAWVAALAGRLAPATINKHLSILASYYGFAITTALWTGENPFVGRYLRYHVARFGRAEYPSAQQVLAIYQQCDGRTLKGLRDRCIIAGMFTTTRRLSEWLTLRWRDVDLVGNVFTFRAKGGRILRQVLPQGQRAHLIAWLSAAGNYPPQPDHYLFPALNRAPQQIDWTRHLNLGSVNKMLKRYGAKAGVTEKACHAHGLRHAGARYRRHGGANPLQLQTILGHRDFSTTEIYIREVLDEPEDAYADFVDALFGEPAARAREYSLRAPDPLPAVYPSASNISRNGQFAPLEVADD